jgi:hypothetical protein
MRDMRLNGSIKPITGGNMLLYYTTTHNLGELFVQLEIAKDGEEGVFITVRAKDLIDVTDVLSQMPNTRVAL